MFVTSFISDQLRLSRRVMKSVPVKSFYYQRFMQVLSRWPRDKCKAPERDLRMFLEKELDKQLSADLKNGLVEAHVEQKLKCFEAIVSDETLKKYPLNYNSGIFGEPVEYSSYWTSDRGREELSLKKKRARTWFHGLFFKS
ncbi:unnamed protein product [Enterobius vermicularis]|uniref:Mitochondrial nucleoid factor 1 n=1 Tax=Enterobius vermicularis TaxID=51028 RepID=A0A0N4V209_ENTVE|nr:unnamed protein product [Enterobius vermicularis]